MTTNYLKDPVYRVTHGQYLITREYDPHKIRQAVAEILKDKRSKRVFH